MSRVHVAVGRNTNIVMVGIDSFRNFGSVKVPGLVALVLIGGFQGKLCSPYPRRLGAQHRW